MDRRRNRPKNLKEPFVQFTYRMMNGTAYKQLSPASAKSLVFFLAKVKKHPSDPQRYREVFTISYGELKSAAHISDKTVAKVFRELVGLGFIDPVKKGGLRGHGKSLSEYRLSTRWARYGQPGFVQVDLDKFVA